MNNALLILTIAPVKTLIAVQMWQNATKLTIVLNRTPHKAIKNSIVHIIGQSR